MKLTIRRCPNCCYKRPVLASVNYYNYKRYYVVCDACACRTEECYSENAAIRRWNNGIIHNGDQIPLQQRYYNMDEVKENE